MDGEIRICPICNKEWVSKNYYEKRRTTCGDQRCRYKYIVIRKLEEHEKVFGIRHCKICGEKLTLRQKSFCSNKCKVEFRKKIEILKREKEIAPICICGNTCKRTPGGFLKSCGEKKCRYKQTSASHTEKRPKSSCEFCGQEFIYLHKEGSRSYCSKKCYNMSRVPRMIECHSCKKLFMPKSKQSIAEKAFCSKKCAGSSRRQRIVLKCENCGSEFEKTKGQLTKTVLPYCNFRCFVESQNKGKSVFIKNGQSRKKIAHCLWCGNEFNCSRKNPKFCSRSCSAQFNNAVMDNGFNRDTTIEIALQNELTRRGYEFRSNPKLHGIGVPDIVISLGQLKIAIEADGDYWHNPEYFPETAINDRKKDAALADAGYKVFRFWEREIKKSAADCIDKVEEYINSRETIKNTARFL